MSKNTTCNNECIDWGRRIVTPEYKIYNSDYNDFDWHGNVKIEEVNDTRFHCPECGSDDVEFKEPDDIINEKAFEVADIIVDMCYTPESIVLEPPFVIVYWNDSTSTKVNCEKQLGYFHVKAGFALALLKKLHGKKKTKQFMESAEYSDEYYQP